MCQTEESRKISYFFANYNFFRNFDLFWERLQKKSVDVEHFPTLTSLIFPFCVVCNFCNFLAFSGLPAAISTKTTSVVKNVPLFLVSPPQGRIRIVNNKTPIKCDISLWLSSNFTWHFTHISTYFKNIPYLIWSKWITRCGPNLASCNLYIRPMSNRNGQYWTTPHKGPTVSIL